MNTAPIPTPPRPDPAPSRHLLNMDFAERIIIDTNRRDWTPSPSPGVGRKPLEREEAERGHTTSSVRFAPGSYFPEHEHPLGEEILVLSGEFKDELGSYPAGTWLRSPHLSRHQPFVDEPTVIWVKVGHLPA